MKVIFIGSDKTIFEEGSAARARMVDYGALFDELHIVVFSKKLPATSYQLSTNVWVYPTRSWCKWLYPFDASRIAKKIITTNYKLQTTNWVVSAQDPFESGLAGKWVAEKTGAKLHIQIHTDFLSPFFRKQNFLNRIRLIIAKIVLPKANAIRVVSPRIKDSLQTTNYKLQTIPTVLPIFVPPKNYSNIEPFDFKRDHPDWSFVILMVGRLEAEKNYELAFKALKQICGKYPRTGLAILGDGRLRKSLKRLGERLGLSKNIHFYGKQSPDNFYRGADVFLQTSNFEGYGLVLEEAAQAGLPIITTDVGAAGWLFRDGENSLVCPVGDQSCLVQKLILLMENNELQEKIKSVLKIGFGNAIPVTKEGYLQKFKESIEGGF